MRSRVEDLKAHFYLKIKGIGGPKSIKCKWPSCLNFYWKLSFINKCCSSVGGSDNKVTLAWTKCSNHITQKGVFVCLIPSLIRVEQGGAHCYMFCHRSQNLYFYINTLSGVLCKVCIFIWTFRPSYPILAIQNILLKSVNTQISDRKLTMSNSPKTNIND